MMDSHIHKPDDGRGRRDVFLDGKRLIHCIYVTPNAESLMCMCLMRKLT
jgi:hypothetical protein